MKRNTLLLILILTCPACSTTPENVPSLRILSYNIKHGRGMDGVVDVTRAAELIRRVDPDLVVLQEIDNGVRRSGGQDQMAVLSELTGLEGRFGAFMPYQGGHYGMGLLSRYPIVASHNRELPPGAEPRSALDARVRLPSGEEVFLCGVHLYRTTTERLAQAQRLVEMYCDVTAPVILAGDFNSTPGSAVMDLIERHWISPDKGEDRFTFPSTDPSSEIDFVCFRPESRFRVRRIDVIDEPLISDHRPVVLDVELHPAPASYPE